MKTKPKLSNKQSVDAATTWCFYIFLGVDYFHHTNPIPWLNKERK
jgi:hypothetical protein